MGKKSKYLKKAALKQSKDKQEVIPEGINKNPLVMLEALDLKKLGYKTLLIGLFQNKKQLEPAVRRIDSEFGNIISSCIQNNYFKGEKDELRTWYAEKAGLALSLLGLGDENKLSLEQLSDSIAAALRALRDEDFKSIGIALDTFPVGRFNDEISLEKIVISVLLGLYSYTEFKTKNRNRIKFVEQIKILSDKHYKYKSVLEHAQIIANAVNRTRDLVNTPPNVANPEYVANYCSELAKNAKLKCTVLDENELKRQNMNCMLAVAAGSVNKPRLVIIEYKGANKEPIVLVGKGITFDSGGLNIKPHPQIQNMKDDKAGACTVIHVVEAAARLKLPVNVIAVAALCENMPSGTSYRPDDVITSHSGITIEVKNTDAEGRMVLADALSYSLQFNPAAIIDVATLTGATKVILGPYGTPVMGNDSHLISIIKNASAKSLEKVWELPMWKEFEDELKSDIADIQHLNNEGNAGTIIGAIFLKNFVKDAKWAHLDIASTCMSKNDKGANPKGITGVTVRLLIEMLRNWT